MYQIDEKRLEEKINTFSKFGGLEKGGITRFALSKEDIQAREEVIHRCKKLGMMIEVDDMGNIYGTLPGKEGELAGGILTGSHIDSVKEGGNYDGVLGVLTALETIETIVVEKIPHRHPVTVVIWTNEEGADYEPALMSSGVLAGKFEKETMLAVKNQDGKTFGEALKESGFEGQTKYRANAQKYAAFLELHIEQGPILEKEEKEIGIVKGVCGMVNYEFLVKGQADHAGTTPMKYRKDALYATAQLLVELHEKLDVLDEKLVYTTGKILAHPNIHTIIPDEVRLTLDARHWDEKVLAQVVEIIESVPKTIAGCTVEPREAWSRNPVPFRGELIEKVKKSVKQLGYSSIELYSGAGHDAQYIADMIPTTMIFVPSEGGRSHCQEEYTPLEQCVKGANVLLNTILEIDETM